MSAYFCVAVAVGLDRAAEHVFEFLAYFYSGVVIQALPGPPQGLGTVELAYRFFFAPFGSPSQILCMAFAIRVVVLLISLPGLIVTATGSYRPKHLGSLSDVAKATGKEDKASSGVPLARHNGEPSSGRPVAARPGS
jgi:hypothetical protein